MQGERTLYPGRTPAPRLMAAARTPGRAWDWRRLVARAWAAYLAGWVQLVRSGYAPPGVHPPAASALRALPRP